MAKIFGHKIPLKMIHNSLKQGSTHHSFLFHGPDGVGKYETAINIARSIHCGEKDLGFCGKCRSCRDIQLMKHPGLLVLSNDSRIDNIRFFTDILRDGRTGLPNKIRLMLLGEMALLLYRHKQKFLKVLENEKKSYPEGVKLTGKKLEDLLVRTYRVYDEFSGSGDTELITDEVLGDLEVLQNCLDRSILSKEAMTKLMDLMSRTPDGRRVVIIQNIHLISPAIAGMFLKLLEEPPDNNIIILITPDIKTVNQAVVTPLRSRCAELSFKALPVSSVNDILVKKFGLKDATKSGAHDMNRAIAEIRSGGGDGEAIDFNLLEIFNKKGYNFSALMDYIRDKSISLKDIIRLYRDILNREYLIKNEMISGQPSDSLELKIDSCNIKSINTILNETERLSVSSNISSDRLTARMLLSIKNLY